MTQKADNYAKAIFELGIPKADLTDAKVAFDSTPELMDALCNPSVTKSEKHSVIDKIFPRTTVNFLKVLTDNGSTALFDEIYDRFCCLTADAENMLRAELIYFAPPSDEQLEGIKKKLMKQKGKSKIDLKLTHDAALIGGFIIRCGDEEIDYSVRGRLAGLSQKLIRR